MSGLIVELLLLLLLLALNGVFAMSELAVVTARKVRLEQRAESGNTGARAALALAQNPTQFLSTVQVGITLIGVLAGAFGGATIAEELAMVLAQVPAVASYADPLAFGIVVTGITYLSLLIGELIPKRVALSHPERVASLIARPMTVLANLAAPVVVLLTGPTNLVLRLFGIRVSAEPSITVEEIRALVEQGAESGVVEGTEHDLVDRVFQLGDRTAGDVMTPRTRVDWIDLAEPVDSIRAQVMAQTRSRFVVCEATVENVLGVVCAEDLLAQCLAGQPLDLRAVMRQVFHVPSTVGALDLLDMFRTTGQQLAVVLDEYGGMQGIVMPENLLDQVVGDIDAPGGITIPAIARKDAQTWIVEGTAAIEEVASALDLDITALERRGMRTFGGLVMTLLGRMPRQGDVIAWRAFRLEIVAMDGRRVERVVLTRAGGSTG